MSYRLVTSVALISMAQFASIEAKAGWWGPSTYEECILDNMKGVTSDTAAAQVAAACRAKFPPKTQNAPVQNTGVYCDYPRALSSSELSKLEVGKPAYKFGSIISGNLYNGNTNVVVRSVIFRVYDQDGIEERHSKDEFLSPQESVRYGIRSDLPKTSTRWGVLLEDGKGCDS